MVSPRPPARKTLWVASGILVAGGLVVIAGAWTAPVKPAVPDEPPSQSRSSTSAGIGAALAASPDGRRLAFRERVASLQPLQAALVRVFLASQPVVRATNAIRLARVRPAATPEACLAQAVYYEARGEPAEGQAAVAQVVLNRTRSGRHPSTVCGAVFEGASRPGCQFSFACDTRLARRPLEAAAWTRAQGVAAEVLAGRGPAGLQTAMNYHADYVHPRWAEPLQRTAEIGRHIFYASASAAKHALAGWTFTAPAPASGA